MLIGLVGEKGSGKDAFASFLPGFTNVKFATPLKNMLLSLPGITTEHIEGSLKEVPCDLLAGRTPRHAMQTLGTEWRDMMGRTLWSDMQRPRIKYLLEKGRPVVVSDVRFHHEADVIRELGGYLVRIIRNTEAVASDHLSEMEMSEILVDTSIYNTGTLEDLKNISYDFLKGVMA